MHVYAIAQKAGYGNKHTVCMCMCARVCVRVCVYTYAKTYKGLHKQAFLRICVLACMCIDANSLVLCTQEKACWMASKRKRKQ